MRREKSHAGWQTITKSPQKKGIERFCSRFERGIYHFCSFLGKVLYSYYAYRRCMSDKNQILPNGKIDIHDTKNDYLTALESIGKDKTLSEHNKQLIFAFLKDAEIGKTIKSGQKKKIGIARRLKYISVLKAFARWVNADFEKVKLADMERVISDLENDNIKTKYGDAYSEETKVDFKKLLKKFYKWLLGANETYPDLVSWFDTSLKEKEIPALSRDEVEQLVANCSRLLNKVAIMVLFDSGARIEEFLNIRIKHLTRKEDYYLLHIEYSKTKPRTISVPLCTGLLDQWIKERQCCDPESQVFPLTYNSARMMLCRLGRKVLKKPVHPHLLRHSSATYYANIEKNYFRFCKRYGWTFGSRMAQRYIDRAGVDEEITAKAVQSDEIGKVRTENIRLKEDMNRLQAQLGQLDKINLVLDEAFRSYPEFREIITTVARRKVLENKI